MNLNLEGKNALVGGSSKGIGKAIAFELAAMGAEVTLVARSEEVLAEVRNALPRPNNQQHDFMVADFSNIVSLKNQVDLLLSRKVIHVLINNTGGPPGGPIIHAGPQEFLQAFNNHLICNHLLATSFLPGMQAEDYGRIINIISTSVKQPLNGLGVSNTIRGAVANWSKTLANEVGPLGVTVNNVLPGATGTQRLESIIQNKANKLGKSDVEVANQMRSIIPMNRFADATEIAAAVAFLASPAASYITGINVPVDGGRTKSL